MILKVPAEISIQDSLIRVSSFFGNGPQIGAFPRPPRVERQECSIQSCQIGPWRIQGFEPVGKTKLPFDGTQCLHPVLWAQSSIPILVKAGGRFSIPSSLRQSPCGTVYNAPFNRARRVLSLEQTPNQRVEIAPETHHVCAHATRCVPDRSKGPPKMTEDEFNALPDFPARHGAPAPAPCGRCRLS